MEHVRKYWPGYVLIAAAALAATVWSAVSWAEAHRGRVFLHIFDVGQGDAILIEAPNGNRVLVDGGPDASVLGRLGEVMPFWDRTIDLVVLTHPHADHLDGLLAVLERYDVGMVLESGVNHPIPEYGAWHTLLRTKGIRVIIAGAGQRVGLSHSLHLDVLTPLTRYEGKSPKDVHDAMVVLKLVHGAAKTLLMGDAERPLERQLIASGADLDVGVLKIGHHGSKTSTAEEFLRSASPQVAIISAGRKNRYGHPTQEVLDRLAAAGVRLYRTDRDGTVTLVSDGREFVRPVRR